MSNALKHLSVHDVAFVCVGTDRSTGDSLGPLIGTYLEELGYPNVYGTLENNVNAENMRERLCKIPQGKTIIAIDSCLGKLSRVGVITYSKGPMKPGAGVNKDLGEVGDYSVRGIVNVGGFMEYFVLQNTRLSLVVKMAKEIVSELVSIFPLSQLQTAATSEEVGLQSQLDEALQAAEIAIDRAVELSKQVTELKKALEWYADEDNYSLADTNPRTPIERDYGVKARQALKGVETN